MGWFWGSSDTVAPSSSTSTGDAYNKLDPELRDFLNKESTAQSASSSPSSSSQAQSQSQSQSQSSRSSPPQAQQAAVSSLGQDGRPAESYRSQMGIGVAGQPSLPSSTSSTSANTNTHTTASPSADSTSGVPRESLFQDGRYAHLWKTYKPLSSIESSQRTEQDQLTDVIEAYNERKASIGRAAVENCVFEQLAEHDCFKRGGWHAKMTMCRDENKAFNRCYQMQSRFLKALGYLGMQRSPEEEERIQMHADKLYQEMLARERAVAKAKEEGLEEPQFKPLLNNATAAEAMGVRNIASPRPQQKPSGALADARPARSDSSAIELPRKEGLDIYAKEKREDIEKRLAGKTKTERELEIQLLVAESQASVEYAEKIRDYYEGEKMARADRKERGRETFGDTIKRMWGWDR